MDSAMYAMEATQPPKETPPMVRETKQFDSRLAAMDPNRTAVGNYKDEEATYVDQLAPKNNKQLTALTTARFNYQESPRIIYRGKDAFGRDFSGRYDDRTIDPVSGKFIPFKVQSTNAVLNGSGGTTWERRRVKSVGPFTMRLASWAFTKIADSQASSEAFRELLPALEYIWKAILLIVPMIFLSPFFRVSTGEIVNCGRYSSVPYRYYGRAKKSRNEKEDKIAQPRLHNHTISNAHAGPTVPMDSYSDTASISTAEDEKKKKSGRERLERVLLPRRLCFLSQQPTEEVDAETGERFFEYHSTSVKQWMQQNNQGCPEYLFVAWNGRQFPTATDCERLHELARYATKEAGLQCYWLSLNCMAQDDESPTLRVLDVWRISDVIRGCKNLVVMLRTPQANESIDLLLSQWCESIWTFPELLLSPGRRLTTYHYSGMAAAQPARTVIPKNQFSARCLATDNDRYQVRRLLDHYIGNLKLSDLELMTVALHCFSSRKAENLFLAGDYSYALMGLLGHRPQISSSDSAFLAFARLSLENYNNRLFERFICLLPAEHGQEWHKTQDAFGAQLWDIEPSIQVAGIGVYDENVRDPSEELFESEYFLKAADEDKGDDEMTIPGGIGHKKAGVSSRATEISEPDHSEIEDAQENVSGVREISDTAHSELHEDDVVILDGCYAATVHWDKFRPVWHSKRLSIRRRLLKWCLRLNFIPFLVGLILAGFSQPEAPGPSEVSQFSMPMHTSSDNNSIQIAAAILLIYSFGFYLAGPFIIRNVYGGKFWDTQPWFFGFEGYLPIEEIEAKIFGLQTGRLMWSPYASSTLSHHEVKDNQWVIPRDPRDDPETAQIIENAKSATPGDSRVFTIVDTYAMTATLFEARRPPEALLVCGSEGGMQRALGCSFEWTTSTFYKETVIRIETRALQRMDRIPRVRLGIQRQEKPAIRRK